MITRQLQILSKHLRNFEIFFEIKSNSPGKKTSKSFYELQIKNYCKEKIKQWRQKLNIKKKTIICKICLKKFTFDNVDLMETHSIKCKEHAELNQILSQISKKLDKFRLEYENIKRNINFEINLERFQYNLL